MFVPIRTKCALTPTNEVVGFRDEVVARARGGPAAASVVERDAGAVVVSRRNRHVAQVWIHRAPLGKTAKQNFHTTTLL